MCTDVLDIVLRSPAKEAALMSTALKRKCMKAADLVEIGGLSSASNGALCCVSFMNINFM